MGARHATEAAQIQARAISIHTPRMGARLAALICSACSARFQSTRPAWGRDNGTGYIRDIKTDFNPHAPHGGATEDDEALRTRYLISIHTPRMGARRRIGNSMKDPEGFQSTRPAWGRDLRRSSIGTMPMYFNPHAPHGGATVDRARRARGDPFQSTRPAWGRDRRNHPPVLLILHFNPHAPHGGATPISRDLSLFLRISIHTPRMGARPIKRALGTFFMQFQSTRPAWGRDRVE